MKLGISDKKRLIINIIFLRKSYEKREISEIKWINGEDNLANALIKKIPNKLLKKLVSTNRLTIRIQGIVAKPAIKMD